MKKRRAARAVARTHISELDMQIESFQRSIAMLTLERNKCYEELNIYQYPVLTLPTEITAEIFTQFLPAYPKRPPLLGPLSPSFLYCICRMWRNVALSTPTLWSAIQLHLDTPRRYEQQLHLLELWLQRSGGCPLSIELVQNRDNATSPTSFIEAVIRSSRRWQHMRLILPSNEYHQIAGPMPLLRSLILGPTEPIGHVDPDVISAAKFPRAPALKDVVLSIHFTRLRIGLPWSQLTTLTAQIMYDSFVAEILCITVSLEECHIKLFIDLSEPVTPIPPLLRLRSFSFLSAGGQVPVRLNHLLAALTLPALQRIVMFEPFLGTNPVAALTKLFPSGNPQRIKIIGARRTFDVYTAAFPSANISVEMVRA
ncbi:hypothetical protein B0H11DRAFT_2015316 [Mycena galericulata]|nr:hypothetical protein B0H11DRAFT_2015316 [Mycena galericulata]